MMFNSIEELVAYLGNRNEWSFDDYFLYADEAFEIYERNGFRNTYRARLDTKQYDGMTFTVDKRLSYVNDEVELENQPMWRITLQDGTELDAGPDEICIIW